MNPKLMIMCAAAGASLALGATAALAGTARLTADPGVTGDSITLGGTAPLSGPASQYAAVARGADAYFKYVNASGGVNGRKILYKVLDDGYNPAQTVPLTRQLVEQDKVFALFNSVGTATNAAVRPYLNSLKVPQMLVASGATTWGSDYSEFPTTSGFQPSYQAEGWVYGKYLARTAAGATVAVLFQKDDYGKDLLGGLKRGLQRSKVKVIAAEPYEATGVDVSSQIAKLKASGADTLAIFATPTFALQAYQAAGKLGWKPKRVVLNSVASSSATMQAAASAQSRIVNGTISIAFLKDPTDPTRRGETGIKLYRRIMSQYAPGANADEPLHVYGMAAAWTAVEALKRAGKNPTRESLLGVLGSFTAVANPFLLPGIAIKTTGKDHFPIEQMVLQRWQKDAWSVFGGLWSYRAT